MRRGPAAARVTLTEQLIVRRFEAGEEARLQAHVEGLSPLSRRYRFLGVINGLSLAEARRLIGDGTGPVFAVAAELDGPDGMRLIGEGVCAIGGDGTTAEFALSVADAWQGQGIGRAILAGIGLRAVSRGVDVLHGEVLRGNDRMLALAARAGFVARPHPGDPRLIRIERRISVAAGLRTRLAGLDAGSALAA
ncbi:GNAT family N-acetyltransferase [Phreatobacter sp. HK31-P]